MIESELTLLQVQVKGRAAHAAELHEARLRHAPEAFYPVDVCAAAGEFIAVVAHPVVLPAAHVDDAVVRAEAVSINRRRQLHLAADNGLETGFFAVRYDLRVDAPVALVDAEDDCFTARPATALTAYAARAEIALVEFDITGEG